MKENSLDPAESTGRTPVERGSRNIREDVHAVFWLIGGLTIATLLVDLLLMQVFH